MITDETIYQQYLRGETNAADLLVEKYADMLIFYINGYICLLYTSPSPRDTR